MNKVLIDTNIYSQAMKGDPEVTAALRKIDHIGFPTISIGELFSGFKGGSRESKNREELNIFLDSPRVVLHPIDEGSAEFYAAILHNLRKAATPIPTNDIWIAAVAFQHGYKIFSNDHHFSLVSGLIHFTSTG